jgi:hypothetical protein
VLLDSASVDELETEIKCIEPYPERLQSVLVPTDNVTLLRQPVQEGVGQLFQVAPRR